MDFSSVGTDEFRASLLLIGVLLIQRHGQYVHTRAYVRACVYTYKRWNLWMMSNLKAVEGGGREAILGPEALLPCLLPSRRGADSSSFGASNTSTA